MFPILLAQMGLPAGAASAQQTNPVLAFLPLLVMMLVFYFLMIRPQQRRQHQLEVQVRGLKKGDRIVTAGGILGVVLAPPNKEGVVVLKTGQDTKLEVMKSFISEVRAS